MKVEELSKKTYHRICQDRDEETERNVERKHVVDVSEKWMNFKEGERGNYLNDPEGK